MRHKKLVGCERTAATGVVAGTDTCPVPQRGSREAGGTYRNGLGELESGKKPKTLTSGMALGTEYFSGGQCLGKFIV